MSMQPTKASSDKQCHVSGYRDFPLTSVGGAWSWLLCTLECNYVTAINQRLRIGDCTRVFLVVTILCAFSIRSSWYLRQVNTIIAHDIFIVEKNRHFRKIIFENKGGWAPSLLLLHYTITSKWSELAQKWFSEWHRGAI